MDVVVFLKFAARQSFFYPYFYRMLRAIGINKSYGNLQVLKNVSLSIEQGEIVSIAGSSGAGKSTLLHILGTLDTPDSGKIFLENTEISSLKGKRLASYRNHHIGFVFQFHHLLPEFTAVENICIPGWIAGVSRRQVQDRAMELLEMLNLKDRAQHKPSELSGGEQQRVAVARALINSPKIVMADEPTGNLDSHNARELHQLFIRLKTQFSQTFLIVTHNEELAAMSDRVLHMKDGQIMGG